MRQWYGRYFREQLLPRVQGAAPAPRVARRAAGGQEPGRGDGDDRRGRVAALRRRSGSRARARRSPTEILKEVNARLGFLLDVGLEYLTLDRAAATLSGGEAQRIRLASQLGSELSGVMYVLDEPSIGLHQRDNLRLIAHAAPAARPRQQRHRGRARRRDDRVGRPRHRLRPGRGPPGRPGRRRGHARGAQGATRRVADRASSWRAPSASRCRPRAAPPQGFLTVKGAREHNLQEHRRRVPAGRAGGGDRRVGRGQVVADQRHPAAGAAPQAARQLRPGRRATAPSSASTRSTR